MEYIKNLIFSSPLQLVLDHLLQNSDLDMSDSQLISEVSGAKRAAIHHALLRLSHYGIVHRHHQGRRCFSRLKKSLPWVTPLKIVSNILDLDPFITKVRDVAFKVVLFGSRATGDNNHESDYDILVISMFPDAIVSASRTISLPTKLQLLIKTPEEFLDYDAHDPVLAQHIRKGIVLWEK